MKILYFLILIALISCAEPANKKKKIDSNLATDEEQVDTIPLKTENTQEQKVEPSKEDISGAYELVEGKTYIIGDESFDYFKASIVIEKLSETDFGFYAASKRIDVTPIGDFGVLRRIKNEFHKLEICDWEDIDGVSEENFAKGLYLYNEVFVFKKGDLLGIIQYGGNFRKYMLYKKRENQSNLHLSLLKTMGDTKRMYQDFLTEYEIAKNYDPSKLEIKQHFNGGSWQTEHFHHEPNDSFNKTHYYQDAQPEGMFIKQDEIFKRQFKNSNFNVLIQSLPTRSLPMIETTSFDDFIEEEDYKIIDVNTLRLEEIYPRFNDPEAGFRAVRCYRTKIATEFHSVVVTILKGEHEMESRLINYDLKGKIIDSKIVSYEEIAEGQSKIESRISEVSITTSHIFWDLIKEVEQEVFKINAAGTIIEIDSKNLSSTLPNYTLILDVIEQLGLDILGIKTDLIVSKAMPQNQEDIIVVIPEIVSEGEHYFELNTHIVLINNNTGKILHQYYESTQTNQWVSDALVLTEIILDTAPYMVAENERAFGVRVLYRGSSRANPHSNETISLFIKSGDRLKKVLSNYTVVDYGGEWDTECSGEFLETKSTLIMSQEKTSKYYNITVKNKITEIINELDEDGVCDAKEIISHTTSTLKYNGATYQ